MTDDISAFLYLISSVCFVLALRGLSSPDSARQGNIFGISGMIIAIGVTTKKNIILIIIGEIIFPKNIPNLNQILLNGVKIFEFNNPKVRKVKEIIIDHILISPL